VDNRQLIDIVASSPPPDVIDRLEEWYSNIHVAMIMKFGANSVERFKSLTGSPDYPTYLNMYHYAGIQAHDERYSPQASAEISKDVQSRWPNGYGIRWRVWYIEHKKWSASKTVVFSPEMILHIVGVNGPTPEKDAEFNEWYDTVHVPWLIKTGTISLSVRYRIMEPSREYPTYLAVYYFDNQKKYESFLDHPERAAAVKENQDHWPNGIGSMWRVPYKMSKAWKK
jgi:hypothetical protein